MAEPRRPDDPRRVMDAEWQRRQIEIEEAQRRGELYANMRTFAESLIEIREAIKEIQSRMVSQQDFRQLKIEVDALSTWRWVIVGGIAVIVFLSQIIPKIIEVAKP